MTLSLSCFARCIPLLPVFLMLSACATLPDASAIENREWSAVELLGEAVSEASPPQLYFDGTAKRLSGFSGCNRVGGDYRLDGKTLALGPLASTRMACPDPAMALEDRFLSALARVDGWKREGERLFLLEGGAVLISFR